MKMELAPYLRSHLRRGTPNYKWKGDLTGTLERFTYANKLPRALRDNALPSMIIEKNSCI